MEGLDGRGRDVIFSAQKRLTSGSMCVRRLFAEHGSRRDLATQARMLVEQPLRLGGNRAGAAPGVRTLRVMSEPMRAPRGGLALAALVRWGCCSVFALSAGTPLDSATIDLRHRWVALTETTMPTDASASTRPRCPSDWHERVPGAGGRARKTSAQPRATRRRRRDVAASGAALGADRTRRQGSVRRSQLRRLDLGKFDDIVDRAQALGLQLVLRLDTSPRWALPPGARMDSVRRCATRTIGTSSNRSRRAIAVE